MERRRFLALPAFALPAWALPAAAQTRTPRIAIVGGGIGGVAAARALQALLPAAELTVIEPNRHYFASVFSHFALLEDSETLPAALLFNYDRLAASGIRFVFEHAQSIANRRISTANHALGFDYAIVATGIGFDTTQLPGYDAKALEHLPHAYDGWESFYLLRHQLHGIADGDVVMILPPPAPSRCTPAPYSRAGLIASWCARHRPKSKVLVLDSKDGFPMQAYFDAGWRAHGERLEWWAGSAGGLVEAIDVKNRTVMTEFGEETAAVINLIPPQHAGVFARRNGLADASGWCPVNPRTMESTQQKNVYVVGDAAAAAPMPKSATAAAAQAQLAAAAIAHAVADRAPPEMTLMNLCYNYAAADYGFREYNEYKNRRGDGRDVFAHTLTEFTPALDASAGSYRNTVGDSHRWFTQTIPPLFAPA